MKILQKSKIPSMLIALIVTVMASLAPAAEYPLADRVPADAIVYSGWAGQTIAFDGSYIGQLLSEMQLDRIYAALLTMAGTEIPSADGQKAAALAGDIIKLVVKHPGAMYVDGFTSFSGETIPQGAVIFDLGRDRDAFKQNFDALIALGRQQEPDAFLQLKSGDVDLTKLVLGGGAPEFVFGFFGENFVIASSQERFNKIMALGDTPEASLARSSEFISAMASVSGGQFLSADYTDASALVALVESMLVDEGAIAAGQLEPIMKLIGLGKIESIVSAVIIEDRRILERARIISPAPHEGVFKLLSPENGPNCSVNDLPADTNCAVIANVDLVSILNEVRRIVAMQDPRSASQVEKALQMASSFLGMSIEEVILANLGPRMVLANSPDVGGLLGLVAMADVKDAVAFGDVLKRLQGMAAGFAQAAEMQTGQSPFTFLTEKVGDTEMTIFKMTNKLPIPVNPTWAIHDGKLIIGLWPQTVKTIIAGEVEMDMSKSASYTNLRSMLSGEPTMMLYCDSREIYDQLYFVAEMAASALTNFLGAYDKQLSPTWMPTLSRLKQLPVNGIVGLWADDGGVTVECCGHVTSIGPVYAAAASSSMAIMLPAMGRSRELAKRAGNQANLRSVGLEIMMFEQEYRRRPESLDELVAKSENFSAELIVSPVTGQRYKYINLPSDAPDSMVWAYDDSRPSSGVSVLLHNGSVQHVPYNIFHNMLNSTQNYMERSKAASKQGGKTKASDF